jgi:hypothetical protein
MASALASAGKFIVARLKADSELLAVTSRIYYRRATGSTPSYPLVTYAALSGGDVGQRVGASGRYKVEPVFLVRGFSAKYSETEAMASRIIAALDGVSGVSGGMDIHSWLIEEWEGEPEEEGSGPLIFGMGARFRLFVSIPE